MKAQRTFYSEQIEAILEECRRDIEDAARQYETEIQSLLNEINEKASGTSETLH